MEALGLWYQPPRLELIEGELINKMGKNRPHTVALTFVREALALLFGGRFVDTETTIDVAPEDNPTNQPEPDLIVLTKPSSEFRSANPQPADLRLVVEISDSTLSFDRTVKARLYARAGIVEYWVFDVAGRRLVVHRDPLKGGYQSVMVYTDEESVSPLASPDRQFRVGDAFPKEP
jgi:Uma2 family endonuclease